jgi:hypothetical protein
MDAELTALSAWACRQPDNKRSTFPRRANLKTSHAHLPVRRERGRVSPTARRAQCTLPRRRNRSWSNPIRAGTKLREDRIIFGRESVQEMEVQTLERPHRLRLFVEHPDLHYELDHLINAVYGGGCRIMLIFRSRSKGATGRALYPLMTPFMEISLRDELERDLSDLASAVAARRALDSD